MKFYFVFSFFLLQACSTGKPLFDFGGERQNISFNVHPSLKTFPKDQLETISLKKETEISFSFDQTELLLLGGKNWQVAKVSNPKISSLKLTGKLALSHWKYLAPYIVFLHVTKSGKSTIVAPDKPKVVLQDSSYINGKTYSYQLSYNFSSIKTADEGQFYLLSLADNDPPKVIATISEGECFSMIGLTPTSRVCKAPVRNSYNSPINVTSIEN